MIPLQAEMRSFPGTLPHQKTLFDYYLSVYAGFQPDYCEVSPIENEPLRPSNRLQFD